MSNSAHDPVYLSTHSRVTQYALLCKSVHAPVYFSACSRAPQCLFLFTPLCALFEPQCMHRCTSGHSPFVHATLKLSAHSLFNFNAGSRVSQCKLSSYQSVNVPVNLSASSLYNSLNSPLYLSKLVCTLVHAHVCMHFVSACSVCL